MLECSRENSMKGKNNCFEQICKFGANRAQFCVQIWLWIVKFEFRNDWPLSEGFGVVEMTIKMGWLWAQQSAVDSAVKIGRISPLKVLWQGSIGVVCLPECPFAILKTVTYRNGVFLPMKTLSMWTFYGSLKTGHFCPLKMAVSMGMLKMSAKIDLGNFVVENRTILWFENRTLLWQGDFWVRNDWKMVGFGKGLDCLFHQNRAKTT